MSRGVLADLDQYDDGAITREEYRRARNGDTAHRATRLHCLQLYDKKRRDQKFCSSRCAGKYNAAKRTPPEIGTCEECQVAFPKKRADSRFCGTRCSAAYDRRQGYADPPPKRPTAPKAAAPISLVEQAPNGGPRDGSPGSLEHVPAGADSREVGPDDDPAPAAGESASLQGTPTLPDRINALLGLAVLISDDWEFTATIGDVELRLRRWCGR